MDVFIIICFITVFAALVEFAILNFFDTLVRRIKKKDRERKTIMNFMKELCPISGGTEKKTQIDYNEGMQGMQD